MGRARDASAAAQQKSLPDRHGGCRGAFAGGRSASAVDVARLAQLWGWRRVSANRWTNYGSQTYSMTVGIVIAAAAVVAVIAGSFLLPRRDNINRRQRRYRHRGRQ